jgi:hypothetical protein
LTQQIEPLPNQKVSTAGPYYGASDFLTQILL